MKGLDRKQSGIVGSEFNLLALFLLPLHSFICLFLWGRISLSNPASFKPAIFSAIPVLLMILLPQLTKKCQDYRYKLSLLNGALTLEAKRTSVAMGELDKSCFGEGKGKETTKSVACASELLSLQRQSEHHTCVRGLGSTFPFHQRGEYHYHVSVKAMKRMTPFRRTE